MDISKFRIGPSAKVDLATIDTAAPAGSDKATALKRTAELTARLAELQNVLYADHGHKILVVLQATDTGGKDGTIRRVFGALNPQGVRVANFKVPTAVELGHDYLWRVHEQMPGNGDFVIFNRSHYEDVLVVRVHDLVTKQRWKKRYGHIVNFEQMVTDEGTTVVKFFLHISKAEQAKRLQARLDEPDKRWKFLEGDLEERKFWDDYQAAYTDMLAKTSTKDAPWFVIPANNKWYRDLVVAEIMVATLEGLNLTYPANAEGLEDILIV